VVKKNTNLKYNIMMNLIFLGAPGAGKGSQAVKIAQKYNLAHLSTGDILRNEVDKKTELGIIAKQYMDKGELLPDDIIIKMVENKIKEVKGFNGFIFDGFPRTIKQAEDFDKMLDSIKIRIDSVILLDVSKEILIERLSKRAVLENRKDDSDISIIENRIVQYLQKTAPLIDYYKKQNKLIKINGIGLIDDIFIAITNIIDKKI